jgi:hypothetical protein
LVRIAERYLRDQVQPIAPADIRDVFLSRLLDQPGGA